MQEMARAVDALAHNRMQSAGGQTNVGHVCWEACEFSTAVHELQGSPATCQLGCAQDGAPVTL